MKNSQKPWGSHRISPVGRLDIPYEDSFIKGYEFEKFVVSRFDTANYFTLLEWRGDKAHNGVSPASNAWPDLEWRYSHNGDTYHFAVECKYREGFDDDCIQWAEPHQKNNYRMFEMERAIKVFVIIGVGGTAFLPAEVFVVPLADIRRCSVDREFLTPYSHRSLQENFFIDVTAEILR